jgi:hypothetical protein
VFVQSERGGVIVGLLTLQLQSCDCGRRTVRLAKLVLNVVLQNDKRLCGFNPAVPSYTIECHFR